MAGDMQATGEATGSWDRACAVRGLRDIAFAAFPGDL